VAQRSRSPKRVVNVKTSPARSARHRAAQRCRSAAFAEGPRVAGALARRSRFGGRAKATSISPVRMANREPGRQAADQHEVDTLLDQDAKDLVGAKGGCSLAPPRRAPDRPAHLDEVPVIGDRDGEALRRRQGESALICARSSRSRAAAPGRSRPRAADQGLTRGHAGGLDPGDGLLGTPVRAASVRCVSPRSVLRAGIRAAMPMFRTSLMTYSSSTAGAKASSPVACRGHARPAQPAGPMSPGMREP
jgi:hypothetical protein